MGPRSDLDAVSKEIFLVDAWSRPQFQWPPNLEYHPLRTVRDYIFSTFAATFHILTSFLNPEPDDALCCGDWDPLVFTRQLKNKIYPCLNMLALWQQGIIVLGFVEFVILHGNTWNQIASQIVTAWSSTAGRLWTAVQSVPISCLNISIFLYTSLRSNGPRKLCNKCRH
jgi:hypothetical protein